MWLFLMFTVGLVMIVSLREIDGTEAKDLSDLAEIVGDDKTDNNDGPTDDKTDDEPGDNGQGSDDKGGDKPKEKPPVTEPSADQTHQFDKARQQEQQQLANSRRRIDELEGQIVAQQADPTAPKPTVEPGEDDDPFETIKQLQQQVANIEARNSQIEASNEQTAAILTAREQKIGYTEHMDKLDKEFGPELRNEALVHARQAALNKGYSFEGSDSPSFAMTCQFIENGYMRAKLGKGGTIPTDTATTTTKTAARSPKADTAVSGNAAPQVAFSGTPDDVIADMQKRGAFKDIYTED